MLSARASDESRIEGLDAGADDYLVKPFAARELLARINSNLQMARLRREMIANTQLANERFLLAEQAADGFLYDWNLAH